MPTKKQLDKEAFKAEQAKLFAEYWDPQTSPRRKSQVEGLLVMQNMPFAENQARKFVKRSTVPLDLEDLNQAGAIGLLKGIRGFDGSKGFAFTTYAAWWVFREMQALALKTQHVHLPKGCGLKEKDFRAMEAFRAITGDDATDEDLGLPDGTIEAWRQSPMFFPLHDSLKGAGEKPSAEPSVEETLISFEEVGGLCAALETLDLKERTNLEKHIDGKKCDREMALFSLEKLRALMLE